MINNFTHPRIMRPPVRLPCLRPARGDSIVAGKTMKLVLLLASLLAACPLVAQQLLRTVQVRTANGVVEGVVCADNKVRTFKGIPFAAPPVGPLRWRAPQPVPSWTEVRKAVDYGPRCMQGPIYSEMIFHDAGPSEDCLYLNLWMPEAAIAGKPPEQVRLPAQDGYPVMHFNSDSESRPDGRRGRYEFLDTVFQSHIIK